MSLSAFLSMQRKPNETFAARYDRFTQKPEPAAVPTNKPKEARYDEIDREFYLDGGGDA